jgi:hydroxymethylpyrimidine pyrophosphatase-like HAD family hydrolase
MRFDALATDYDGTIADEGVVDEETVAALRRARAAGLQLILVTGRELVSLFNTFERSDVFDWIVAENGAVLYHPSSGLTKPLCSPAPPQLIRALEQAQVPISVGHTIVASVIPFDRTLLAAIRDLGLPWHIIFNKESVMALPSEVTKATGLTEVWQAQRLAPERTIGIGDAENDEPFLRLCGLSVAVENALPELKQVSDLVTAAARGDGVRELIERLLSGQLDAFADVRERRTGPS